ncbi:MAG: DNA repair protein RecO [Deltaproteobacteria bacterium]|nr:DNA repair protein RecO [Candidatus Anaeroferrophillus wilburensis]MBN2890118.1 DNA repair protein RecO [Deltaproteobacteria bacterium]
MPTISDQAFIIHKTPYGESDLLITLFTLGQGRITAIGKGAKRSRKRFSGRLELFSNIRFNGFAKPNQTLVRLDECELLNPYRAIQHQQATFFAGCYFLEIVNRCCPEQQANRDIFILLHELFDFLNTPANRNFACQIRLFELQIVALLGFAPSLHQCLDCGLAAPAQPFFDPGAGGLLCNTCRHRHPGAFPISRGTIAILNKSLEVDRTLRKKLNFTPQVMEETARLCRTLLHWHTGRQFKSLKYVDRADPLAQECQAVRPPSATNEKLKHLQKPKNCITGR